MNNKNTYVAIMAGGVGSRFWPYSRTQKPKQFLDALNTGKTLIQQTYERFLNVCPKENIFIITNQKYVDLVHEQLPETHDDQILKEPFKRDTAPCIAYASQKIYQKNNDATIIVSPSDHIILKEIEFVKALNKAVDFASKENILLTLGIKPTNPNTGYGYIQFDEENSKLGVSKVKAFTEKPNLELANQFIESGDFLWNSGTFIWKASSILKSLETLLPDIYENIKESSKHFYTDKEEEAVKKAYETCNSISIDYGILEKSDNTYVIPADIGWSDIGTWNSLYNVYDKDYLGNAVNGNVQIFDSSENIIMGDSKKMIVLNGVRNLCVIDTEDVLLITTKDREQEIKKITTDLSGKNLNDYL
jgi:mannose-1-phosphate guanylyltransferase